MDLGCLPDRHVAEAKAASFPQFLPKADGWIFTRPGGAQFNKSHCEASDAGPGTAVPTSSRCHICGRLLCRISNVRLSACEQSIWMQIRTL